MGMIKGLKEYLDQHYHRSVFSQAAGSDQPFMLHLHGFEMRRVRMIQDTTYDIIVSQESPPRETIPKVHIKFLYPADISKSVEPLIKVDKAVKKLDLEPIYAPNSRFHIKNKSLYPLMLERRVMFCTLLEGDRIRGIVGGFNRYEISIHLKGGIPVTVLRHAVYRLEDKQGRSFLKSFQEKSRDWEKSAYYVSEMSD